MNHHATPSSPLDSTSGRYLLALVLLLLLHAPLWLLRTPNATPRDGRHVLPTMVRFLPERHASNGPAWADLYAWSDLVNPQLGLQPGRRGGLTFSPPLHSSSVQSLPNFVLPVTPRPPAPAANNLFLLSLQHPLSETVWLNWPRQAVISASGLTRLTKEPGVYWRLANGAPLQSPPDMPPDFAELWQNAEETARISGNTRIEIEMRPALPLPRLIVRESCGSSLFDLLAVKALRLKLGENPPLPPGNHSVCAWLVEIEWYRPGKPNR